MAKLTNALLLLGIALFPWTSSAADFDGKGPLLCASSHTVECASDGNCRAGASQHVNLPHFLRIDFKAKQIRAPEPTDVELTTSIEQVSNSNGRLVLQGVDAGRGWSLMIRQDSGHMTLTVSDDHTGFVVFGSCLPGS